MSADFVLWWCVVSTEVKLVTRLENKQRKSDQCSLNRIVWANIEGIIL